LDTPERAAFLLCGGFGTRLRSITDRPKAVLEVAGWPFLRYQLEGLREAGPARIVFLTGYGADEVEREFGPGAPGWHFLREEEPLGTAGALAHARHLAGEANWISNADSFADIAPERLFASAHRDEAIVLAVQVEERSDYGGLLIDEEGRISGFEEKGKYGPGWINAGVYLLPRPFLYELPEGPSSLERDFFPRWAREGRLRAHRADVLFRDIGTPERLRAAQEEFVPIRRRLEGRSNG
jgi:D-glycero-alpha-D-manno-heptose 1-phosphate guanylyltransferase